MTDETETEIFDDTDYNAYHYDNMRINPIDGDYYHVWIHKVVEKLNSGKDVVIIFAGEKGNGKSYAMLRLAEILQEELNLFKGEFDVGRNFVYDPLNYLDIMRNIDLPEDPDADMNPNREIICIDEAGLQAHKKDYYDTMNDAISDMLDIQRKAGVCLMFGLPHAADLDSRIKQDVDFVVEMIDVGVGSVTGYGIQHGRLDDKQRFYVDFNQQELLVNPNLNYQDDWGAWSPDEPKDEEKLKKFTEKENKFKSDTPEEKYQEIKKKREEEGDEKSEEDKLFEEALQEAL